MASDAIKEAVECYTATRNTTTSTNPPMVNLGQDKDDQVDQNVSAITMSGSNNNNNNNNIALGSPDQETAKSKATDDITVHEPIPNPGPQPTEAELTPSEENTNNAADDTEPAPDQEADESAQISHLSVTPHFKFPSA
jgi:hypothetical protein